MGLQVLRSKTAQIGITLVLCLVIIAAGSIAWFSFTQTALNEFSFSPEGVNLHDDFNDPNKDVYVENSGTEPLLVRVKLREFTTIDKDLQIPDKAANDLTGIANAKQDDRNTWFPHDSITAPELCTATGIDSKGDAHSIHEYWQWIMGGVTGVKNQQDNSDVANIMPYGQKWYVPAKSTQLLAGALAVEDKGSDLEGKAVVQDKEIGEDGLPSVVKKDKGYKSYEELTDAINADIASNTPIDPQDAQSPTLKDLFTDLEDAKEDLAAILVDASATPEQIEAAREAYDRSRVALNKYTYDTYGVHQTETATVITMAEWKTLPPAQQTGDFWVIGEDGWCYWASPLEAGEATGLLLDAVLGGKELRDARTRHYYGIDVIMQAATVDDAIQFWKPTKPEADEEIKLYGPASDDAWSLLKAVGWKIDPNYDYKDGAGRARAGVAAASAGRATTAEADKGKFWYISGGVWKYHDGQWRYDGSDWTLNGEAYDFDPSCWYLSDGEWKYLDDYWFFDGIEWIYLNPKSQEKEPDPPPENSGAVVEEEPKKEQEASESSEESSAAPETEASSSDETAEEEGSQEESSVATESSEASAESETESSS